MIFLFGIFFCRITGCPHPISRVDAASSYRQIVTFVLSLSSPPVLWLNILQLSRLNDNNRSKKIEKNTIYIYILYK